MCLDRLNHGFGAQLEVYALKWIPVRLFLSHYIIYLLELIIIFIWIEKKAIRITFKNCQNGPSFSTKICPFNCRMPTFTLMPNINLSPFEFDKENSSSDDEKQQNSDRSPNLAGQN